MYKRVSFFFFNIFYSLLVYKLLCNVKRDDIYIFFCLFVSYIVNIFEKIIVFKLSCTDTETGTGTENVNFSKFIDWVLGRR